MRKDVFRSVLWILGIAVLACGCGAGKGGKADPAKAGKGEKAESKNQDRPGKGEGGNQPWDACPEGTLLITVPGGEGEEEFELEGERLSNQALSEKLRHKAAEGPKAQGERMSVIPVVIRVERGAPFGRVVMVLVACARNMIFKITYRMRAEGGKGVDELELPLPADRGISVGSAARNWVQEVRIRESGGGGKGTFSVTVGGNEHLKSEAKTLKAPADRGAGALVDEKAISDTLTALNARYRANKPSGAFSKKSSKGMSGISFSSVPDDLPLVVDVPGEVPFEIVFRVLRASKGSGLKSITLRKTPEGGK
ncbi:MAG: hypothetical protein ACYTHM_11245 [Planctomycetota bacterium]|jgi:biopolymer transport protein ExbD